LERGVNSKQNPYNIPHHTNSVLPHYLQKVKVQICDKLQTSCVGVCGGRVGRKFLDIFTPHPDTLQSSEIKVFFVIQVEGHVREKFA